MITRYFIFMCVLTTLAFFELTPYILGFILINYIALGLFAFKAEKKINKDGKAKV